MKRTLILHAQKIRIAGAPTIRRHRPTRYLKAFFLSVSLCMAMASTALGWNKPGHMVTGALAYYELKSIDPAALAEVINLLKKNPYYQAEWLPRINTITDNDPDKHNLYLFMYAARWPDDIRGTSLHCDKCHYVNHPFKPAGQPNSVVEQPAPPQNILSAYKGFTNRVQQPGLDETRARALCWIFHLIGDVHQPLHTSALFTVVFPEGDRGGTLFYIREEEDSDTMHLHSFWDGRVMTSQRFSSVRNRARGLRARSDLQRADLNELTEVRFDWWAKESFTFARKDGYLMGQLEGSPDELDGAVLPEGYPSRAQRIAERRAVLAGYRLADVLSGMF